MAANLRAIASTTDALHEAEKNELRDAARLLEGDLAEAVAEDIEALTRGEQSPAARGFWNAAAGHVRARFGRAS